MPVVSGVVSTVRPSGTGAFGSKRRMGRPLLQDGLRARVCYLAAPATGPDALRARIRRWSFARLLLRRQPLVGRRERVTLYRTWCPSRVRRSGDLGGRGRSLGGPDQDDAGGAAAVRGEPLCVRR